MSGAVELRHGCPIVFGDADTEAKYRRCVRAAKAAQKVRFAVAPRARVKAATGRVLVEGEEVTIDMLQPGFVQRSHDELPIELRSYLQSGHVIEADNFEEPEPPHAA